MRGIPNDSFLPLDRNVAINVELFLYGNAARTQGEVKINATAYVYGHFSVLSFVLFSCYFSANKSRFELNVDVREEVKLDNIIESNNNFSMLNSLLQYDIKRISSILTD